LHVVQNKPTKFIVSNKSIEVILYNVNRKSHDQKADIGIEVI